MDRLLADYQFGEAGRQIDDFLWGEFCDWYIEASQDPQARRRRRRCSTCWSGRCACCTPSCPSSPRRSGSTCGPTRRRPAATTRIMLSPYPQADAGLFDEEAEREMGLLMDLVRGIRNARAEFSVEAGPAHRGHHRRRRRG